VAQDISVQGSTAEFSLIAGTMRGVQKCRIELQDATSFVVVLAEGQSKRYSGTIEGPAPTPKRAVKPSGRPT
jgi:hypothetical protein